MVFFLYYLENARSYHRFAISVNRKVGNAVERNFIKRKMKELFRLNQHLVNKHYDFWVIAKKKFDKSTADRVEELFLRSLKNIDKHD